MHKLGYYPLALENRDWRPFSKRTLADLRVARNHESRNSLGGMVQRAYEEPELSEVLDRVPLEVRQSLTFEQRAAISKALQETRRNHAVDVRFTIPLVFTQLYFVTFIGKDRRRAVQEKMVERRWNAGRYGIAMLLAASAIALTGFMVVGAYVAKSRAGIDLMPNAHASDLVKGISGR